MNIPIHQLLYMSKAAGPMSKTAIFAILDVARHCNKRDGITGLLIYRDGKFLQLLEGDKPRVHATYERIRADKRHNQCITVMESTVERRLFETWSMAYGIELVSEEQAPKVFLNLDKALKSDELDQKVIMSILEFFAKSSVPKDVTI